MVDTNPKKKTPTKVKHWLSTLLLFFIGFIVLLLLASMIVKNSNDSKYEKERAQMEQYLEEKYGKDFVVKNYRIEGAGLGVDGDPVVDAYPKDNESLVFFVLDRGDYKNGEHGYIDSYLNILWGAEEEDLLLNDLERIYGYRPDYKVIVGSDVELDTYKVIPSFGNAVRLYGKHISMELKISAKKTDSIKTRNTQIWNSLVLIRKTGLKTLQLNYCESVDTNCVLITKEQIHSLVSYSELVSFLKKEIK